MGVIGHYSIGYFSIGRSSIGAYKVRIFNASLAFFDGGTWLIDIVEPALTASCRTIITQ